MVMVVCYAKSSVCLTIQLLNNRLKSFLLGFFVASGVGFWWLVMETQAVCEDLKISVRKVYESQKALRTRLENLENRGS